MLWILVFGAGLAMGAIGPAPTGTHRGATTSGGHPQRARAEIPSTAGVMHGPRLRGSAVYPAQSLPLKFSHAEHLKRGHDCTMCHREISKSRRSADLNLPRGADCDVCHGAQHPKPASAAAQCDKCHTKVDAAGRVTASVRAPRPNLHFNHTLHRKVGAACEDCHRNMDKVRLATTLQLPTEADCLSCHDGFGATNRCGACHPTQSTGRLRTRTADDRTLPALVPRGASAHGVEHDLSFVEDHVGVSKANPKLCDTCHDETFCSDCHAGSTRPMRIHAGDYMTTHALDARARTQDCQSCHRTQTFCQGCHERLGFGNRSDGAFATGGGLTFHPPGWSGPPGSPQSHAHAAQRNLPSCVSCHNEDSCLACHATATGPVAGLNVNPHGRGFATSARCEALLSRNRRMCLRCHAPGDPQLACL